jgi:hypothetical protein
VLGLQDGGGGLVDTTLVAALAWGAAALGLLLITGAVAYAVGRRRWSASAPVGALGLLVVIASLVLASLSPPPTTFSYVSTYTVITSDEPGSAPEPWMSSPSEQGTVPMPDVLGIDYYEAEAELRSFGFRDIRRLEPRRASQGMEPDFVRTQYPAAGQQVLPGDVVVVLDTSTP